MSASMLRPIGAWALVALSSAAATPPNNSSQQPNSSSNSTDRDWWSLPVAANCLAPADDIVHTTGKCGFPNPPQMSYEWDPSCRGLGGEGCVADGLHCECRFCGEPYPPCGDGKDVTTSRIAPSESTTQEPSPKSSTQTKQEPSSTISSSTQEPSSTSAKTTSLPSTSSSPSTSAGAVAATSIAQDGDTWGDDTNVQASSTSAFPVASQTTSSEPSDAEITSPAPSTSSVAKDTMRTASTTKHEFLDPKKNGVRKGASLLPLVHFCLPLFTVLYTFSPGFSK